MKPLSALAKLSRLTTAQTQLFFLHVKLKRVHLIKQLFLVALIYTFCAVRAHLFTGCACLGNFELRHHVLK